jgi:hypothetical protein
MQDGAGSRALRENGAYAFEHFDSVPTIVRVRPILGRQERAEQVSSTSELARTTNCANEFAST